MVTIRRERKADVAPREALLDVSYGSIRFSNCLLYTSDAADE